MTSPDFDAVRQPCPTQDELRVWGERAHDEAASLAIHKPHAQWEVEHGEWMRLASAAFVCHTILVRRALAFVSDPRKAPPEEPA